MRLYARAVELGSLSAVAREENIGQPTMSKMISALEKDLGVRLLQRTTTSLTPTEEGRRYYERCKQILEEYADAVADVRGQTQRPIGKLAVSAPMGLGELRLNALVLKFLEMYPEIEIELNLTDRIIDLVDDGIDVAIRIGDELPPNAIARDIAWSSRLLVATPKYVERAPRIRRPEDLLEHPHIGYARAATGTRLEFSNGKEKVVVPAEGRYRVNSSLALRECFLRSRRRQRSGMACSGSNRCRQARPAASHMGPAAAHSSPDIAVAQISAAEGPCFPAVHGRTYSEATGPSCIYDCGLELAGAYKRIFRLQRYVSYGGAAPVDSGRCSAGFGHSHLRPTTDMGRSQASPLGPEADIAAMTHEVVTVFVQKRRQRIRETRVQALIGPGRNQEG